MTPHSARTVSAATISEMIEVIRRMMEIWGEFDIEAYEELTGDEDAADVAEALRRMLYNIRKGSTP